ncbi:hypothetical protein V2J09_018109 [Rumex salicifolius]
MLTSMNFFHSPEVMIVLLQKLVKWNKTVFKNIQERKKILMGKLDVIQQQITTDPNQDLISADSAVQQELLQGTLALIGGSEHCILPLFDHHSQKEKPYSDVER